MRNTDYAHTIFSAYGTASEPPLRGLAATRRGLSRSAGTDSNLVPNHHEPSLFLSTEPALEEFKLELWKANKVESKAFFCVDGNSVIMS
jgi:hypothetical protein